MKKIITLIFIVFFVSHSYAANIAFIDLDLIFQNSISGKKILKKLEDEKKIKLDQIKKMENDIKKKDNDINAKKNIISKNEFESELEELKINIKNYNVFKTKVQNEFDELKNKEIMNFFKEIDIFIKEYLDQNSIDILFNNKNIVIGKDNLDITEKIINIINNQLN